MLRSSCPTSAVVAVTSVQPTSEKRTVWQLAGSPVPLCSAAAVLNDAARNAKARRQWMGVGLERLTFTSRGLHDCT
jgi:hypothetical protein